MPRSRYSRRMLGNALALTLPSGTLPSEIPSPFRSLMAKETCHRTTAAGRAAQALTYSLTFASHGRRGPPAGQSKDEHLTGRIVEKLSNQPNCGANSPELMSGHLPSVILVENQTRCHLRRHKAPESKCTHTGSTTPKYSLQALSGDHRGPKSPRSSAKVSRPEET
jgi:hypothetical protein